MYDPSGALSRYEKMAGKIWKPVVHDLWTYLYRTRGLVADTHYRSLTGLSRQPNL